MKILIVHQHYLFPGQPGGSRFNEMARLWSAAGHDVTVVAGNRNYGTGQAPKGFERRWTKRTRDGRVTVWRCHVPSTYNSGTLGRMWAFVGFTITSVLAGVRCERPDVIVTTSPPLTVAITGWILAKARFRGARWVFEVRDLWPESAVSTGVLASKSALTRLLYRLESVAYRACDKLNVLTPAFRDDILRRRLASPEKVMVIPNGADLKEFVPDSRDSKFRHEFGWGDRFVVLYAGAQGLANAVHQLVGAAAHLSHRSDILIVSAGDGPQREVCEQKAKALRLDNIMFVGPIPKEEMPALVNSADVGAAVLQANPTFRTVYPNKVFDYFACAKPVLVAIDGVARTLVCEEAQAGIFAEPENGEALARGIEWLADHPAEREAMGARGHSWVVKNASREKLADDYLDMLKELVSPSPVRTLRSPVHESGR